MCKLQAGKIKELYQKMNLNEKIEYMKNNVFHCNNRTEDMKRYVVYCSKCNEVVGSLYLDDYGYADLHYHNRLVMVDDEIPYQWKGCMSVNIDNDWIGFECSCGNDTRDKYVRNAFLLSEIEEEYEY